MTTTRVPGPAGLPLLGSMLDLRRDPLATYLAAHREHGDVVRFTAGPPGLRARFYMVFSPAAAQRVLATDATRFRKDNDFYEELRHCFGNGLLTSQDGDYHRQRRLVQPLFTRRQVDGYGDVVAEEAADLARRWAGEPVVDVLGEMTEFALRVVSRVLFGTEVDAATDVVRRCFPTVGEYVFTRGFAPVAPPRSWPTPANRRAAAAQRELRGLCDRIVAARRAADTGDQDLLSLLARAADEDGDRLDDSEVRDQVLIFLLAGHETTATSLAFAIHLLARHPEVQERARAEVVGALGGRAPTARDLDALPLLARVLKETMRLYPAAPLWGRRCGADVEVEGHVIPAGSDVYVSPWVTHRHPAHWPDPERFDPDRFLPEQEARRPRYAWFPFGGGPRACIGQHFSMLESVLALAVLLQRYRVEPVDEHIPLGQGITLRPKGPMRCALHPARTAFTT